MSGQFSGWTLSDLNSSILWELGQVSGTTVDQTKFPLSLIRKKLTIKQNEFVYLTHCLKKFALVPCVDGQRTYRLPKICMEGGLIGCKFFYSSESYESLEVVDQDYMDNSEEGYRIDSDATPSYAWMGATNGQIQTMEVDPPPDTDGTDYLSNLDTGIYYGSDLPEISDNLSGTTTSAGAGTTITDSGTTFTNYGIVAGMWARNVTDGSYGRITNIATNAVTTTSLTGGSDDTWASGDSYLLLAGDYGVVTNEAREDRYLFGYKMGALSHITVPAYTFMVDFVPYPIAFASDNNTGQYPEIPKIFHEALGMGVVADILRSFHEQSKEFQRAQYYDALFQSAVAQGMAKKESRPWKNKPVRLRPGRR